MEQWARQRRQGTHANDAGLLVHQANVCFCGAHLTPRGAALYDRKVGSATWATWYTTWLLIKLTPKGVVRSPFLGNATHTALLSIAAASYEHTNN